MFVTVDEVQEITSYEVNDAFVQMAQFIIEAYVGRAESDVLEPNDLRLLRLATAYQAAYISENTGVVFEQVGVKEIQQDKFSMRMSDETSPYIAPLAKMACQRLSWFASKSISTAPAFYRQTTTEWRAD